jgi:hypothetical protein
MFTPKANSKQRRLKKTQEHETGDAVTVQLAPASESWRVNTQGAPPARLQLDVASCDSSASGKTHFSPQNPNFDFPMPKFDLKVCLNVSKHEKTLKSI